MLILDRAQFLAAVGGEGRDFSALSRINKGTGSPAQTNQLKSAHAIFDSAGSERTGCSAELIGRQMCSSLDIWVGSVYVFPSELYELSATKNAVLVGVVTKRPRYPRCSQGVEKLPQAHCQTLLD